MEQNILRALHKNFLPKESTNYEIRTINLAELVKSLTDEQAEFLFNELKRQSKIIFFGVAVIKGDLRNEIDCTNEEFEEYCRNNDFNYGFDGDETYQDNFNRWKECQ
jgi:hypothetical protein